MAYGDYGGGGRGWGRDWSDEGNDRGGARGEFRQGGMGAGQSWSGSRGYYGGPYSGPGWNREAIGAEEWNRGWGGGIGNEWNRGGVGRGEWERGSFGGGGSFNRGYGSDEFEQGRYGTGSSTGYGSRTFEERQRGGFTGRGPKGWRRSNERIQEEVNEALARDPDVDASDIEVRVENGEVTLMGVVEDRGQKRRAEDIVEDIFGVDDVHNELKIRHGFLAGLTGEKADEREIARGAEREPSTKGVNTGTTTGGTRNRGREATSR